MSSNISEGWSPYVKQAFAASLAIVVPYKDLVAKSYLQKEKSIPKMTKVEWLKGGVKLAPITGFIVGGQLWGTQWLDKKWVKLGFVKDPKQFSCLTTLCTPAIVGFVTSPFLAIFNGYTNNFRAVATLKQLPSRAGLKMCMALALQETAFVAGIKAGEQMERLGKSPGIAYAATYATGAIGSLAGHAFNTAVTRWQDDMIVSPHQLMLGAVRKARAIGLFAVLLKYGKEKLNA